MDIKAGYKYSLLLSILKVLIIYVFIVFIYNPVKSSGFVLENRWLFLSVSLLILFRKLTIMFLMVNTLEVLS